MRAPEAQSSGAIPKWRSAPDRICYKRVTAGVPADTIYEQHQEIPPTCYPIDGIGPRPKIKSGETGTSASAPTQITVSGEKHVGGTAGSALASPFNTRAGDFRPPKTRCWE